MEVDETYIGQNPLNPIVEAKRAGMFNKNCMMTLVDRTTGRAKSIVIDRFDGAKVRDTRIIMDTLGLMMQIGAIAPPPAA